MTLWEAALLGVVQGLTEFLPISSTAHLLVVRELLGHAAPEDAFTTVIQLGTLVAVFAYFRRDLVAIAAAAVADFRRGRPFSSPDGRLAWYIVLGSVPVALAGLALKKVIKAKFYDPTSIALVTAVFALLMLAAEVWHRYRAENRGRPERGAGELTWKDALWMGLWQACALMPGASRSGTTLTGGLFAGLERASAARFTFLLSLPAILGAGLKDLYDEYKLFKDPTLEARASLFASQGDVAALAVGTLVSAVVGYLSIAWLLGFLKRFSLNAFVVYRLALAAAILLLVWKGLLR